MMLKGRVLFVAKSSKSINTQKLKPAQEAVPVNSQIKTVRVKSVKFVGYEDVYNMEVENHHNFAVNGGFIVHNCMDALRYACRQYMDMYDGSMGVDWGNQYHIAREMGLDI